MGEPACCSLAEEQEGGLQLVRLRLGHRQVLQPLQIRSTLKILGT
jgi:hypothetical protein